MFSNTWVSSSVEHLVVLRAHARLIDNFYTVEYPRQLKWTFGKITDHRRAVELAGLDVEGCSLLDGAEAGDAEGLTGLGDGVDPAADVLELTAAEGVLLLGDELAVLVEHEVALGQAGFVLLAGAVPHLAAGSTDTNATGHFRGLVGLRAGNALRNFNNTPRNKSNCVLPARSWINNR